MRINDSIHVTSRRYILQHFYKILIDKIKKESRNVNKPTLSYFKIMIHDGS